MSYYSKDNQGFTLTELLVSIAIVSVILAVVVSSQSTYTDGVALTNLADEISSTISQAQSYGIGVREFSPSSSEFSASYGLTFSLLASGSDKDYLSFADRNGDKIYNGDWSCPIGGASECREKVSITRGNHIESLCVIRTSGADICEVGRADISFARPSTEAQILFFNLGGLPFNPAGQKGARVVLKSPSGSTRSIIIYKTGQVSVQ
ncbi:MAG: prepilin-type N-terminal cleavage/methylation domain-containing protein [bacterium]|nr:prepilin-type N-terminal cleavage/methylation domain-containing protein [bacterium]